VVSASSVGYAAIFVLASVCTRAPITVRKLLATLGCEIVEEKYSGSVVVIIGLSC
jgi:hypothetical protein